MFFCDICLTTMERNMAETDTQRINSLETKIGSMGNQLSEIKDMLMVKGEATVKDDVPIEKYLPVKNYIWFNKENLKQ